MISFNYELSFQLDNEELYAQWIQEAILSESKELGEVNYIFCDDEYLLNINKQFLNHDYYTDIISFDYSEGDLVQGDIFISMDRVKENADDYKICFEDELKRVIIHGILHYCGYKDKTEEEEIIMRMKEDEKILLFHVKQ